jgi:hypothetical protein
MCVAVCAPADKSRPIVANRLDTRVPISSNKLLAAVRSALCVAEMCSGACGGGEGGADSSKMQGEARTRSLQCEYLL